MDALAPLRPTALPALLFLLWLPLWPLVQRRHSALFLTSVSALTLPAIAGFPMAAVLIAAIVAGRWLTECCAAPPPGPKPRKTAPTAWSVRFAFGLVVIHAAFLAILAGPVPYTYMNIEKVRPADRIGVFVFFSGVGLTFFRLISYYFDRRRHFVDRLSWGDYLAYMLYFPQFRHGPIERADAFAPRIREARARWSPSDITAGLGRAAFGVGTLVIGGQVVGGMARYVFGMDPQNVFATLLNRPDALAWREFLIALHMPIVLLIFMESGFASIALGVSRCYGIVGHENYDWMILSRTPRELWKRWNITTFTWLRDYLYRECPRRRFPRLSMFMVFLYVGVIHGLQWRFLTWGVFAGGVMVAWAWVSERVPAPRGESAGVAAMAGRVFTFHWCAWLAVILLDDRHCGWLAAKRFAAIFVGWQ
ncbi:MAG: hypothetical protein KDA32_10305 [Phycisphaerales bacterium]|nr:hypothetical protein [Phycisphaerales bacterium]